jgi:hypothetical protein
MYHASEVCFKTLVQTFCLAIGLWVVGGAHVECGVGESEELLPNRASE